jgi:acyl carrier protein
VDIEQQVRQFIVENMKSELPANLTADYRLIDNGVLDSMAMFEVIAFIENSYGIEVEDADLSADNFETTRSIAALVSRKSS